MVATTTFSQVDLIAILDTYNLGVYRTSRPISAGTVQTNYRIETTQGAFVLKYYENRSYESVQFEADVVRLIQAQGFPCADVYPNQHGEYISRHQQKPYMLFEFVEGDSVDAFSPNQLTQVAQLAARLQTLATGFRPETMPHRWNYTPELCLRLAQQKANELDSEMSNAKLRWYEREVTRLELPDALPKGVCHTDFDPSNVLFNGDEVAALLDFDDANYTYLTFDLIALIDGNVWPFGGEFNPSHARKIVHDYMAVRPLSEVEKSHLFDVHKLQIFFDGIWFYARGEVDDFYEKRKVAYLDSVGRDVYYRALFG
ncbi:MAG: homoserine kinase [Anaerolineaceae bacterium]|nr:homoserine kinase [Anaerolineaceae bacterium]